MSWTAIRQPDCLPAPTWRQALNPVWLASDVERYPAVPWFTWFRQNWFANAKNVIVGVAHRPRWWISTMGGENFPVKGWGMAWCIADGCLPRPWIAYRGPHHEFGIGWKSHGGFGVNYRRERSTNGVHPKP